jgi:arylsulfate sulfotransferase
MAYFLGFIAVSSSLYLFGGTLLKSQLIPLIAILSAAVLTGCGSDSNTKSPIDFSLTANPSSITVYPGGVAQTVTLTATPASGFSGNILVSTGSLPAGIFASPSTLFLTPGTPAQIKISAVGIAAPGTANISFTGIFGTLTHTAETALTIAAPSTTASLSTTAFDFGANIVNNTLTQSVVTVTNTGPGLLTMNPTLSGDPGYSIAAGSACGDDMVAGSSCEMVISYTPTTASAPAKQTATLNMGFGDVPAGTPQTVTLTGTSANMPVGQVAATNNPQVALYTMTLPFPGSMTVNFGKDTNYGLKTWTQSTSTAGGAVSIFVAGMTPLTTYHMQAVVAFSNGLTVNDADHAFTTQDIPTSLKLAATTTVTPGMTPQPGVELLNPLNGVIVTDLSGNELWTYLVPGDPTLNLMNGVKMLPNGDFLLTIGTNSSNPLHETIPPATILEMREVNLAGDTVRKITIDDLNAKLATATCNECNVSLLTFHHDVEPLPNGHWLVLGNTIMNLSSTTTPPLTNFPPQPVLGDVIVDLDQNLQPVWAWNTFNHLDPNRHPYQFADWTHTNAVIYSKDDGNILVSMRHQNWVIKVKYADGTGDGSILWRLGQGGDFTLKGGTDPTDWQYAQHYPSFFSPNTTGVFSLGVMDNGDDRMFPSDVTCGSAGAPPCLYTTIPVYQIDEGAKTAALTFHQILPTSLYSFFGGNTDQLANGDVEYDLCPLGQIFEVTPDSAAQTVWNMHTTGTILYRAMRIPSLYPGVQW